MLRAALPAAFAALLFSCQGPLSIETEGLQIDTLGYGQGYEYETYATVTPGGFSLEDAWLVWKVRGEDEPGLSLDSLDFEVGKASPWHQVWVYQALEPTPDTGFLDGIPGFEPQPTGDQELVWKRYPFPWTDQKATQLGDSTSQRWTFPESAWAQVGDAWDLDPTSAKYIDYVWVVAYRDKDGGAQLQFSDVRSEWVYFLNPDGTGTEGSGGTTDGDDPDEAWSLGPVGFTIDCGGDCVGSYVSGSNVTTVAIEWSPADDANGDGLDDHSGALTERYQLKIRRDGAADCVDEYVPFGNGAESWPDCWIEDRNTNVGFGVNLDPDTLYHLAVRASRLDADGELESGPWTDCRIRTAGPPGPVTALSPAGEISATAPGALEESVELTWERSRCDASKYVLAIIGPSGFEESIEVDAPGEDPAVVSATSLPLPVDVPLAFGVRAITAHGESPPLTVDDYVEFRIAPLE